MQEGAFRLDRKLILGAPADAAELFGQMIGAELKRAGFPAPEVCAIERETHFLRLSTSMDSRQPAFQFRDGATSEDYALELHPDAVVCAAPG